MKQKDLAVLVAVLIVSVIISVIISSLIFGSGKQQQQVATVDKITPDFPVAQVQGNDKQFNGKAFNPVQVVNIGQPNNHPFAGGNQQ